MDGDDRGGRTLVQIAASVILQYFRSGEKLEHEFQPGWRDLLASAGSCCCCFDCQSVCLLLAAMRAMMICALRRPRFAVIHTHTHTYIYRVCTERHPGRSGRRPCGTLRLRARWQRSLDTTLRTVRILQNTHTLFASLPRLSQVRTE